VWGPILGAALLMLADEAFKEFSDYRNIGLGLIMALFVLRLPEGLSGLIARSGRAAKRCRPADDGGSVRLAVAAVPVGDLIGGSGE
jgi:hypothetical protein